MSASSHRCPNFTASLQYGRSFASLVRLRGCLPTFRCGEFCYDRYNVDKRRLPFFPGPVKVGRAFFAGYQSRTGGVAGCQRGTGGLGGCQSGIGTVRGWFGSAAGKPEVAPLPQSAMSTECFDDAVKSIREGFPALLAPLAFIHIIGLIIIVIGCCRPMHASSAVSYTHLTLPTNHRV